MVQIATGTVSQQQGLQDKGYEEWAGEIIGMRDILKKFANVSRAEIVGTRAPFLKPGRNTQFKVRYKQHNPQNQHGADIFFVRNLIWSTLQYLMSADVIHELARTINANYRRNSTNC